MILKSYIIEKNISILDSYYAVLFYGENIGLKDDFRSYIINTNKDCEKISLNQNEIIKNPILLDEQILNTSLFSKKKLEHNLISYQEELTDSSLYFISLYFNLTILIWNQTHQQLLSVSNWKQNTTPMISPHQLTICFIETNNHYCPIISKTGNHYMNPIQIQSLIQGKTILPHNYYRKSYVPSQSQCKSKYLQELSQSYGLSIHKHQTQKKLTKQELWTQLQNFYDN